MNNPDGTLAPQPIGVIRPGLLDRLKAQSGIRSDEAFAGLFGTSRATLQKLKAGNEPSLRVAIRIATTFGLGLGEVVEMREPVEEAETADDAEGVAIDTPADAKGIAA